MTPKLSNGTIFGGAGLLLSYIAITAIFIASLLNYNELMLNLDDSTIENFLKNLLMPEHKQYRLYISNGILNNRMGNSLVLISTSFVGCLISIISIFFIKMDKETIKKFHEPLMFEKIVIGLFVIIIIQITLTPFGNEDCSLRSTTNLSCSRHGIYYPLFVIYLKFILLNTVIAAFMMYIRCKFVILLQRFRKSYSP